MLVEDSGPKIRVEGFSAYDNMPVMLVIGTPEGAQVAVAQFEAACAHALRHVQRHARGFLVRRRVARWLAGGCSGLRGSAPGALMGRRSATLGAGRLLPV